VNFMGGPELQKMIQAAGLTQREVAKVLNINERTMRRYVLGELPIPKVIELAVTCLVEHPPVNQS
jgi:transcriptional regulator with XRE-family HTH domain